MMRQLRRWVAELWHWLAEAKLVVIGVVVILAAIILGFFTWPNESSVRIAGYFLQVIGMIVAIWGLLLVRSHFGQPSLRALSLKWLKRFPKWKRGFVTGMGAACSTSSTADANLEVWAPDDPEKTFEHRLNAILKNLDKLRVDQREHTRLIGKLRSDHESHKQQVAKESSKIQEDIRADLETLHTNDVVMSLVGLVWLLVGITMSTLAPELSLLVHQA